MDKLATDIAPYDGGELAALSRVRDSIAKALAVSPRTVLTEDTLRKIASELDGRRKKGLPPITPRRLAFKLRSLCRFAKDFQFAASLPKGGAKPKRSSKSSTNDGSAKSSIVAEHFPAAEDRKKAQSKLRQAATALAKIEKLISSAEVAVFVEYDPNSLEPLHDELSRLTEIAQVGWGSKRGNPALTETIRDLHLVMFQLTGSWLRGVGSGDREDSFLIDTLFELTRAISDGSFSGIDIESSIETAIRTTRPYLLKLL